MNLIETSQYFLDQIIKKTECSDDDIEIYIKFYNWLDELYRYRLMFSEIQNEIELSTDIAFSKAEILTLLQDERDEWQLDFKEYDK